jgi:redox-sensitive bicupin YhaK (pirin superfamily)
LKMTEPRYQDVKSEQIPEVTDDDGTSVRVLCGSFWGRTGPVEGVAADPQYLDVFVPAGKRTVLPLEVTRHAFAYVIDGDGVFIDASAPQAVATENVSADGRPAMSLIGNRNLILFDQGDSIAVQAGEKGVRFLLVSGKPLREPVAWRGPIVMNTQEELMQAFRELREGTFIKGDASTTPKMR